MAVSDFKNKKVLVFGLGLHGGGAGSAAFFAGLGAIVLVTDLKTKRVLQPSLKQLARFKNIKYVLGQHRKKDFMDADLIIKNPGVADNSPFLRIARVHHVPVSSDIEFFFANCPARIIGITGTKGKSTTAYLLFQFLKAAKKWPRVWLAGNIRKSVLEILPAIRKNDIVVLELSSFQLDSLREVRLSPHIAVITNIFPDHLNRYRSFVHYARAKAGIFRFQKKEDYLFLDERDALLKKLSRGAASRTIFVNAAHTIRPWRKIIEKRWPQYQQSSLALAASIAQHLGVSPSVVKKVFSEAAALPGRLEMIRRLEGVTFVNDTTATNPGAAIAALQEVSKRGRVVLIAGGSSKNLPSKDFAIAIQKLTKTVIFLPGEVTVRMKRELQSLKLKVSAEGGKSKVMVCEAKTMREAVRTAWVHATKGDVVLLSPGAASFGLFQHEFDRGEQFIEAVKRLH